MSKVIFADLKKFRKLGLDVSLYDKDTSENLYKNDFDNIVNSYINYQDKYEIRFNPPSGYYFIFKTQIGKLETATSLKRINFITNEKKEIYVIKCPTSTFEQRINQFNNLNFFIDFSYNSNNKYEVNNITLNKTREIDEDFILCLEQIDRKLEAEKQFNAQKDQVVERYCVKLDSLKNDGSFQISKALQHNLIPKELKEKVIKTLPEDEQKFIDSKNIKTIGIDSTIYQRKVIMGLLKLLSTTPYRFESNKFPVLYFKKSTLYKAFGLKKRIKGKSEEYSSNETKKVLQVLKELAEKKFLFKYRLKDSDCYFYKIDKLYEYEEGAKDLIITFKEPLIRGLRHNDKPYYSEVPFNHYEELEKAFNSKRISGGCYALYDLIFLEKNKTHREVKQVKENIIGLVEKLGLLNYVLKSNYKDLARLLYQYLNVLFSMKKIKNVYTEQELTDFLKNKSVIRLELI